MRIGYPPIIGMIRGEEKPGKPSPRPKKDLALPEQE